MEPFTTLTAGAVPLDLPNIDTDRLIPARFLKKLREAGLGEYFFHDVRFNPDGSENGDFILNQAPLPGGEDPGHRGELRRWLVAGVGGVGPHGRGIPLRDRPVVRRDLRPLAAP